MRFPFFACNYSWLRYSIKKYGGPKRAAQPEEAKLRNQKDVQQEGTQNYITCL